MAKSRLNPPKARFKLTKLTPLQQRQWDETVAACSWLAPGFTHIMYTMLVPRGRSAAALFTDELNYVAATDGYQIIINPKRFFAYPLLKRVFINLHEIMHNIWDHC